MSKPITWSIIFLSVIAVALTGLFFHGSNESQIISQLPQTRSPASAPIPEQKASTLESYFRWGGTSTKISEHSTEITRLLSEFSATKAGKINLGENESGGRYFHFYVSNKHLSTVEAKLKSLLGNDFFTEKISEKDIKSKVGNTRIIFVLYASKQRIPSSEISSPEELQAQPDVPAEKFIPKNRLELGIFTGGSMFKATDNSNNSKASFSSQKSYGVTGAYAQQLSPNYHLKVSLDVKQVEYAPIDSQGLNNASQLYLNQGITLDRQASNLHVSAGVGTKDTAFIHTQSSGALEIKKLAIPYASLGVKATVVEFVSGSHLDAELTPCILFSRKSEGIKTKKSYGANARLTSFEKSEHGRARGLGIRFSYENQKSNFVNQEYFDAAIEFIIGWDSPIF